MTPLAQTNRVVDTLQELVNATNSVSVSDWITAGAAIASAILAGVLVYVTSKYTSATHDIRDANKSMATASERLADANDLMVQANNRMMQAAESNLDHMVKDREVMLNEPSRRAAERLQHALAGVEGSPFGKDEEELERHLGEVYASWAVAHVHDSDAIRDDRLRRDLQRFMALFLAIAKGRDSMRMLADEQSRRLAPPALRLRWLVRQLAQGLGEHRRGEPVTGRLPAAEHAWSFWELPAGIDSTVWKTKMMDPEYDPAPDIEDYELKKGQPRKRMTRAVDDEDESIE